MRIANDQRSMYDGVNMLCLLNEDNVSSTEQQKQEVAESQKRVMNMLRSAHRKKTTSKKNAST